MQQIQLHPGYALAFKMKVEEQQKELNEWATENILKPSHPDLLSQPSALGLDAQGNLILTLPNAPEPTHNASDPSSPLPIVEDHSHEMDLPSDMVDPQ